ncbi:HI0074 family nucleotidyltransferase substrate-binding subunit [Geothermobacter hydrogeniphilus]|uniref:Nucleotidyltransferase n=1 Tax=Geothermobacter hydrogeniphilus TaxID=1969733 RepID=A0A1X0YCZ8_9BACT|nr:HI0074 family nucleotidyltransferase substrate-binding subunit [Geothermobacter hydrogeniphilus]ORJ62997.1 nucleotidyltransferase [Geothermobacter hydrogeniphilus]
MDLDLSSLKKVVASLDAVLAETRNLTFMNSLTPVQKNAMIAGAIQNFEFTYELCWKFLKRWMENNISSESVEGITRRQLFRLAVESRLIDDVERWMIFHRAHNQTSHVYDEEVARDVYQSATEFLPAAKALLAALEARND